MRLKVIACKVLYREISLLTLKGAHIYDVTYLRQGYHDTPELLQQQLQKEIDKIENNEDEYTNNIERAGDFDAIGLGYGLCSNGIVGLKSTKYPLVIPKAHDCITLFLGSKERYQGLFDKSSGGIYWYNAGWIDNAFVPSKERYEQLYTQYAELYGEDNAEYLLEMENSWMREYKKNIYIRWEGFERPGYADFSRECARFFNWEYEEVTGKAKLLEDLLSGNWDSERFLVVQPGQKVKASFDSEVITVEGDA